MLIPCWDQKCLVSFQANVPAKTHIAVIGAGAFGGWTALFLLRGGARVTLLDAWGAGNSRASSGGETRIIRGSYGPNQPYTRMAVRALQLWKEHQQRWCTQLFHHTGVLWMAAGNDDFERGSLPSLREAGMRFEELSADEMARRWPQVNFEGVHWGIYEPESGFLGARVACQIVVNGFIDEGGTFQTASVLPEETLESGCKEGLKLSDGTKLVADKYVFACGPWLGTLFPETIGEKITATRQELFFFGPPPGDSLYSEPNLPVWGDNRERFWYGIPASNGRGFKVADDTRGCDFDPTCGDRTITAEALQRARDYIAFRFPGMKNAPLIESRVCQYENTPDHDFIIDRHPRGDNVWIVGGGSGHGFKHGPAVGEMVSELVLQEKNPLPRYRLSRFNPLT
ncbi:MAG: FAD-dependent oxidoreductase [Acidobacteriaceae bacterium]|nr:FAD-dependent oxidoreductase [Acidobacteriaceae bacterium]